MTEPSYLAAVRESYDNVAAEYVRRVMGPSGMDPLGRAMLIAFAELVQAADRGPVADVRCCPGRVTAHLAALGLPAFGIDLSPKMIEMARQAYPGLRFAEGSMTALDLGDDELGGILAWFPPTTRRMSGCRWCLQNFSARSRPAATCCWGSTPELVSTCARRGRTAVIRCPTSPTLLPPDRISGLLGQTGLTVTTRLAQEPARGRTGRTPACWPANPDGRLRGSRGGRSPAFDPATCKQRNIVERAFCQLRQHRAVATRYDKRDFVWRGTVDVASIRIWLRHPT